MSDNREITRPYPGLRPFESWEGEIFFGREEHINRLLDILKERRFLAVIGPSGSGKSSLVRAGLLPALPLGSLGTGCDWRIALMRPGNRPIRSLAHALLARSILGVELVGEERIPQNEHDVTPDLALIEADLRRGPLGLIDVVQDARTRQTGDEAFNLLVLVDQFEELFTYADAGGNQADEAEAFVNLLLACQSARDRKIYIVLTMRTDFLGNCMRFLALPDAINRCQYLTPRLTREQIERAITSPAYLFGGCVEPTLVTELINTASNDQDQLPILQHLLSRMWDEAAQRQHSPVCIAWNDFHKVGGIANALSQHADEILAALSSNNKIEQPLGQQQQAAMYLFRAITEQRGADAGGQVVRRPQSLKRIAEWSGRNWQDFKPVIDGYSKEGINFIHINALPDENTVIDISHEALIRQWRRLQHWVMLENQLARRYENFRNRAEDFKTGSGALLTGADLARALEWRLGLDAVKTNPEIWRPNANWANRYHKNKNVPSAVEFGEVLKFIDDSHAVIRNAKKRARIVKRTLITLTLLSIITTIGAFGFAYQSYRNQIMAEAALLWTPLDFGAPAISINEKQAKGLAKLKAATGPQQGAFFEQLLKDSTLAERFSNNPEAIMTALVGIDPKRKNKILQRLDKFPHDDSDISRLIRFLVLSELQTPISSEEILSAIAIKDDHDLPSRKLLGERIKTLIVDMPDTERQTLSDRLLTMLKDPESDYESAPVIEAFGAIIERLPQDKLKFMSEQLIEAIKTANNPVQIDTLKQGFMLIMAKIQSENASMLTKQLLSSFTPSLIKEQSQAFAEAMAQLAAKLPEVQGSELAEQLLMLIKNAGNAYPYAPLGQSFATLAAKMPGSDPRTALLANRLLTVMSETTIPEQFDTLGLGLSAISARIPASDVEVLVNTVIRIIKDPTQLNIIKAIAPENKLDRFMTLGQVLAALIQQIPAQQTENLASQLFSLIMAPMDAEQYYALGQGLVASVDRVTQPQADILGNRIMAAMQNIKSSIQFSALGEGLAGTAKRLSARQAQQLAQQIILSINKLENRQSYLRFDALGKILAELASTAVGEQANALAGQLINAISASDNRMQIMAFGAGAAKAAANIPEAQIVAKATLILSLLNDSNDAQLKALVKILEALVKNLPQTQALDIAGQLIADIKDRPDDPKDELERIRTKTFGKGLKAVSARIQDLPAEELAGRLTAAIIEVKAPGKHEALAPGLAAACANSSTAGARILMNKLITAMKTPASPSQYTALGKGLAAAAERLPETGRTLAKQLIEMMLRTQNSSQLDALGQVLDVITGDLEPGEQTLAQWFELLKNPLAPRQLLATAIRHRLADAPKENQGVWTLIEWARQHHPDIVPATQSS